MRVQQEHPSLAVATRRLQGSPPPGGPSEPMDTYVPSASVPEAVWVKPRTFTLGKAALVGLGLGMGLVGCAHVQPVAPPEVAVAPADLEMARVDKALGRVLVGQVDPAAREVLARGLMPFGPDVVEKLADHGLTIEVPREGYAHYDLDARRITFPLQDLLQDREIPFRDYMILHEFAHALDFLLEPDLGPLSERSDLGIAAHRNEMGLEYAPLLRRFEELGGRSVGIGRVSGEDFITVVEAVTGQKMSERPARGHIQSLDPETRPTEYFADAVYTYLHSDPVTVHRYSLPDGQTLEHAYPPNRGHLKERDPRMYDALKGFFSTGGLEAEALQLEPAGVSRH